MGKTLSRSAYPPYPYKGLQYYEAQDAPIFAGREDEIAACARLLSNETAHVTVLHGSSGCGKSSFLRAGLIPYLEQYGFEFLKESARKEAVSESHSTAHALLIRCTESPILRLAENIYQYISESLTALMPQDDLVLSITTREEFCRQSISDPNFLIGVLRQLGGLLSKTLVFIIDQAEELLTLNQKDSKRQEQFFGFINAFIESKFDLRILLTVRADYFSVFYGELCESGMEPTEIHSFHLRDMLTEQKLTEIINRPTSAKDYFGKGSPLSKYGFQFSPGIVKKVIDDILNARPASYVLPAVQLYCAGLYKYAKKTITAKSDITKIDHALYESYRRIAYHESNLVESLILSHIDESIRSFIQGKSVLATQPLCGSSMPMLATNQVEEEIARWKQLLATLTDNPGGLPATKMTDEANLRKVAEGLVCLAPFEEMMRHLSSDEQRILRVVKKADVVTSTPKTYLSLGHDSVGLGLNRWVEDTAKVGAQRRSEQEGYRLGFNKAVVWGLPIIGLLIVSGFLNYKTYLKNKSDEKHRMEAGCSRGDPTSCAWLYENVYGLCTQHRDGEACRQLAGLEERGKATSLDLAQARAHYDIACQNNILTACYQAGILTKADQTISADERKERALFYFRKSCTGNSKLGCDELTQSSSHK